MSAIIMTWQLLQIANTAVLVSREWYLVVFVTSNGIYVLDKIRGTLYHFINRSNRSRRRLVGGGLLELENPWDTTALINVYRDEEENIDFLRYWSLYGEEIDDFFDEIDDEEGEFEGFLILERR
jgi:hypothetical protein